MYLLYFVKVIIFSGVYPSNVETIFFTPHVHFSKISRSNLYSVHCNIYFSSLQIVSASFQFEFTLFEKKDVHLDKFSVTSGKRAVIFYIPTGVTT